ncbi:MAG: Ras- protein Rab-19 [Marteilia pararefringens]
MKKFGHTNTQGKKSKGWGGGKHGGGGNASTITVALCGNGAVGKTETAFAIVSQSSEAQKAPAPGNTVTTIGLVTYPITIDGMQVKIYDLGGQDGFREIINGILHLIDIVMIIVDITRPQEYDFITKYITKYLAKNADKTANELEKQNGKSTMLGVSGNTKLRDSALIIAVANKRDLIESNEELHRNMAKLREVIADAQKKTALRLSHPVNLYEISATERTNISQLIEVIKEYGRSIESTRTKKKKESSCSLFK